MVAAQRRETKRTLVSGSTQKKKRRNHTLQVQTSEGGVTAGEGHSEGLTVEPFLWKGGGKKEKKKALVGFQAARGRKKGRGGVANQFRGK